ncbi:Predicted DNA-binding protein, contains Ribbon-helix-helix (RHH) domain [Cohaesibacter sp. ES.047]|uniref:ribbon-helix-helix domain-containing protein n=1 Tax=Cohaesibacter sp. ES.047 TaxID=1798205 RepID=UPI000BB8D5AD|nr:ribbon-helix-helix domain-containing protein [Cohaesibacter sp. ES.047]SNY94156.1 Predicted DNA-binding protein, contains Ribbon-helix-helix (RHH) domain [Cohaesibacter sp. ES.047]
MCQLFIGSDPAMWECETRSLRIDGMVTSIRLESFFWQVLEQIAKRDGFAVTQLISKLYHEAEDADHNLGNFTSFLRVCCGRFLALQLTGDIPQNPSIPIRSLNAERILDRERNGWAEERLRLVK